MSSSSPLQESCEHDDTIGQKPRSRVAQPDCVLVCAGHGQGDERRGPPFGSGPRMPTVTVRWVRHLDCRLAARDSRHCEGIVG
eukprot:scaffold77003_cov33-Tisochrysis_lutea.AAC.4